MAQHSGGIVRKFDIALMLARKYGFASYLEVVTPTTGGTYGQVDRHQFSTRMRLMYRRPAEFLDGETIDFSTQAESAEDLYLELINSGRRFDLVFLDPFHTYASSLRDIVYALQLVQPGGSVLIHDCDPPREEIAGPEFRPGEWCGVTYLAYLDTVLFDPGLCYATVDADYGCGIISKKPRREALYSNSDRALASEWRNLQPSQKFSFFIQHRARLLHLVDPITFTRSLQSLTYGAYRVARRTARDMLNAMT
jgi:hypothetical protein